MLMVMSELLTTDDLLHRIANGDQAALASLFDAEAGRLIAIALRFLRRHDLAEEVVQEVFVNVWRRADQFDASRGNARAWLTMMTRNRALNLLRNDSRTEYHDSSDLEVITDRQADAIGAFDALTARDALRHCLEALDEPKRRAILLCYVTGLNHGEAAAAMNAPLGTVKAWIRRGVISLQECLS